MNDLSRRELLVALLQAFFLSLFPWLRNERGVQVVKQALEVALPKEAVAIFKDGTMQISIGIKGFEVSEDWYKRMLEDNPEICQLVKDMNDEYVPEHES